MEEFFLLSGVAFLFRFLPVFLVLYYLFPEEKRKGFLFFGSLFFYALGQGFWVLLLLGLTMVNYAMGRLLYSRVPQKRRKKKSLSARLAERKRKHRFLLILTLDAGILILFKLLSFFFEDVAVPVGLSFYLFKMLSWQIDLYRGDISRKPGFWDTAAYFTMFPQLTQGPIMRYEQGFGKEAESRADLLSRLEEGLFYVFAGFSMKLLLADKLGAFWNTLKGLGAESLSTVLSWLGAFAYTFQLYFDFWGYSLIAAGVGIMLGFPFILNFNHPYAGKGIGDFYRRWHVSLGTWFRDYIYIPLGGSRNGKLKLVRNLMIVWLVTGFWHGSSLNFLLWGLVLGLLIVLEKLGLQKLYAKLPLLSRLILWFFIPLTWVIFAFPDLTQLGIYFARLFPFFGIGETFDQLDFMEYLSMLLPLFGCSLLLCIPAVFDFIEKKRKNPLVVLFLTGIFWYAVYTALMSQNQAFLYFNF